MNFKTVSSDKVVDYLNASDIAFAIRKPSCSMQGVAPIKLGEYLLTGLPTIASKGIGDTEEQIVKIQNGCFLYDHSAKDREIKAVNWVTEENRDRNIISKSAKDMFSLEKSAEKYINAIISI